MCALSVWLKWPAVQSCWITIRIPSDNHLHNIKSHGSATTGANFYEKATSADQAVRRWARFAKLHPIFIAVSSSIPASWIL